MQTFFGQSADAIAAWLHDRGLFAALEARVTRPLLPYADNFTPPTRTPWGGANILNTYKQGLVIREDRRFARVGESWEISADPAFPCQFAFDLGTETVEIDFIQLLDLFPEQILGTKVAQAFEGQNPILVKLLDAAAPLSVQVHPADDYAGLGPEESGKPESWYILDADPGCGLYLGLKGGISPDDLRQAIEQEDDVSAYLNFVPVAPGDFFVIDAGTIHAIGAGVTLIEPQKIAPRKSGKTYRLWDWNRTYDEMGQPDPNGRPRQLHIEESFEVIKFVSLRGESFVARIQPERCIMQERGRSVETLLVDTENFGVRHLALRDGDPLSGFCRESFHGLVVYKGRLTIEQQGRPLADVPQGQSVILPACLGEYRLTGADADAVKVYYPPQFLGW